MSNRHVTLFVCTGNTCRSPMAEGALMVLLEKERPGQYEVFSAGTSAATGHPATMYAIEAARTWDCDITGHSSQPLTAELIEGADLVFAMTENHHAEILRICPKAAARTYLLKSYPDLSSKGAGVADPIGRPLEKYNHVFLEIGEYLGKHLPLIVKEIDEKLDAQ